MGRGAGADVVIVGGGSCGSVLAARLSEDPGRTVLLLEAGPERPGPEPAHRLPIGPGSRRVRRYPTTLRGRAGESSVFELVRGVGLGGSGAVNGAYFVRATPADLDAWPGASWSYEAALEHFRRSETDRDFAGDPVHGDAGEIPVRRPFEPDWHPVTERFVAAARAAGFADEPDKNAPGPAGIGPVPGNIDGIGMRADPAAVYLTADVRARPNLMVRTGTAARRILLRGGRAVGVEVLPGAQNRAGEPDVIGADRVVLAAGAIASPALLWRSGLADPQRPRPFSDHPEITLPYRPAESIAARSPASAPLLEACLNIDGGEGAAGAVEVRPYTASFAAVGIALMTPRGRGVLRADPGSPWADPIIEHRYLEDPADLGDARAAVDLARRLVVASGMGEPGEPRLGTSQHLSGTCPMGADPQVSTVDERCRLRGVEGAYIVDTSVFPRVPSRGPHATAVMLAERAARFVAESEKGTGSEDSEDVECSERSENEKGGDAKGGDAKGGDVAR